MPPFWVVWPLRKAALVPAGECVYVSAEAMHGAYRHGLIPSLFDDAVAISAVALGAAVGSFDLTKRVVASVLPAKTPRRPGSSTVAWSSAIASGSGILVLRELFFAPPVVPGPALPVDASVPLVVRLRNAGMIAAHAVLHYPYAFRFTGAFAAGSAAAVAYVLADRAFNATSRSRPVTSAKESQTPPSDDSDTEMAATVFAGGSEPGRTLSGAEETLSVTPEELDGQGSVVKYADDPYER